MGKNSNDAASDVAVLVLSCDLYSDLWTTFFDQFNKYWSEADFRIYLACNEQSSGIPGVIDAFSGPDKDWSTSILSSLEKVEEQYVLLMIDDAFLCERVDHQRFLRLVTEFKNRDMDYFRLKRSPYPDVRINNEFGQISPGQLYRTSLFPSLWKKNVLCEIMKPGESAWEFELKGSDRSDSRMAFYGVYKDMFQIIHGVIKGKWHPKALSSLEKEGIDIVSSRSVLSFAEVLGLKFGTIRHYGLRCFPGFMRKNIRRFIYRRILNREWFS